MVDKERESRFEILVFMARASRIRATTGGHGSGRICQQNLTKNPLESVLSYVHHWWLEMENEMGLLQSSRT